MATAATAKQVKVKHTKPKAAEDSLEGVYEELVKILGRLRYRTSYGQNVLKHTLEVVQLPKHAPTRARAAS